MGDIKLRAPTHQTGPPLQPCRPPRSHARHQTCTTSCHPAACTRNSGRHWSHLDAPAGSAQMDARVRWRSFLMHRVWHLATRLHVCMCALAHMVNAQGTAPCSLAAWLIDTQGWPLQELFDAPSQTRMHVRISTSCKESDLVYYYHAGEADAHARR